MKITLVSPYSEITAFGLRVISACLKREGHEVRMIFLPDSKTEEGDVSSDLYQYPPEVMARVLEICRDSEVVGITVMTYYYDRAAQLTEKIRESLKIPVIWGGIHPTIKPEESLEQADIICVGEGEGAMVELMARMDKGEPLEKTANFWFRNEGGIIRNQVRPLLQDVDALPYPDYDLSGHYVWNHDTMTIDPMDKEMFKKHLTLTAFCSIRGLIPYQTMITRGCLLNCAYCCNSALRKLYRGQRYVRRRSVENIIGELEYIKREFPFIQAIDISDDSFFDGNEQEIEKFCRMYKTKIGIPFRCLGSPLTITDKKMDDLVKAGMFMIQIGIETGSRKGKKLYRRNIPNDKIIKAARIMQKYKDAIDPPLYDIIVDNPYEGYADNLETLRLLVDLPRPYNLQIFSLVFYYGTALYEKAREDGKLGNEGQLIYRKQFFRYQMNYLNLLMALIKKQLPVPLIKFLMNEQLVKVLSKRPFDFLFSALFKGYHLLK